jgi:hypothetical protein
MATVKADAHFVDGDIATGSGGDWEWEFGGYYPDWIMTYFSSATTIEGLPLVGQRMLYLSGTAEDINSVGVGATGLIGITMNGHPFSAGQPIVFHGTGGTYDGTIYTLDAATTANQLVFEGVYLVADFDAMSPSPTAVLQITFATGLGRTVQESSGNMYFGCNSIVNGTQLFKISQLGAVDYDFFSVTVDDPWRNDTVTDVMIFNDQFIYVVITGAWLYKFDLATGELIYRTHDASNSGGLQSSVDDVGDVYMMGIGPDFPEAWGATKNASRFDGSTGLRSSQLVKSHGTTGCYFSTELVHDGDTGFFLGGGSWGYFGSKEDAEEKIWNLNLNTRDGSKYATKLLGELTGGPPVWQTESVEFDDIKTYGGFIYALTSTPGIIYKLDTNLNIVSQSDVIDDIKAFYFDPNNNLVVIRQQGSTYLNPILFYTPDFVYQGEIALPWYFLHSWNDGFLRGRHHFYANTENPTEYIPPGSRQYRTVAYPEDYRHLEGQEVQVLADGTYLDDQTYTISSGAVSPTYTATTDHVGLQVVSRLQPMKIDGDVNIKKIRQIIPDVSESVGGEYGKELDDMYTMELRDTNDIMERDNALYSGYVELPYKGEYDRSGDIWIKQDIPLPMNVLGIGVRLSKEDK